MSTTEQKKERNTRGERKERGDRDRAERKERTDKPNERGDRPRGKNPLAKDPVQKEFDAIRARITKIQEIWSEKLAAIRELENTQYVKDMRAAREVMNDQLRPKIQAIKDEETHIRETSAREKEVKKAQFDQMKEALPVRQGKGEAFEDFIRKNYEAVDRELEGLQQELREVKNLQQEKQAIAAIERNKALRRKITDFEQHRVSTTNFGERLGELREQRNQLQDEFTKQKKIVEDNQALHDVNYQKISAIRKELDALKTEREALNKEATEKRKILDEKFKEWQQEQKQRDIEFKERKAREAAERAAEEKAIQKEELLKPPKQEELQACEDLIKYLKNLKYNKKKPSARLNHGLEAFGQFAVFGLTPPSVTKQVADSIAALETKRAEIKKFQEEALEKRAAEAAKKEAEDAQKAAEKKEETQDAPAEEAKATPAEESPAEVPAEEDKEVAPAEEAAPEAESADKAPVEDAAAEGN